jgi:uncharacterized protein YciI
MRHACVVATAIAACRGRGTERSRRTGTGPERFAGMRTVTSRGVATHVGITVSWRRVRRMPTFVLRLIAPRPSFAETLTDSEREIMNRHAAHWRPYLERGDMVVFGPVLTDEDSYGLAVVETDDEQALREFASRDPVVTTGTAAFEVGRLAAGHVRGR